MNFSSHQTWVLSALAAARAGEPVPKWCGGFPEVDSRSEAVFFFKPEIATLSEDGLVRAFEIIDGELSAHGVEVTNIGVLGYSYLNEHNVMGEHYGVINKISTHGANVLSSEATSKIRELGWAEEKVFGGHQFLEAFPQFTAVSLSVLWDNLNQTSERLAPGTYAMRVQVLDEYVVLLNGFHPYQLEHFTSEGRAIVVAILRSNTSWGELRDHMIGSTDPTQAQSSSVRAKLLANAKNLGIPVFNKGLNGVHLSAGPLEGMVETIRFTSQLPNEHITQIQETNFGFALCKKLGPEEAARLAENPDINVNGSAISAFDATELKDPEDAIALLRQ